MSTEQSAFIRVGEVRRLTGWTYGRITRAAMLGRIRFKVLPGSSPLYARVDVLALKGQGSAKEAAG
jgi:hypothetical protein